MKAQETLAHCWLWLSSPPIPPKSQSSSISKDATALAEPPSSPSTSPALPPGEFGFPCLQQVADLPQDLVSCSKAKIQVYCQHCTPALQFLSSTRPVVTLPEAGAPCPASPRQRMLCCRSAYKLRVYGDFSSSLLGIIIERVVVVAPGAVVVVIQKPSIGGVPARESKPVTWRIYLLFCHGMKKYYCKGSLGQALGYFKREDQEK